MNRSLKIETVFMYAAVSALLVGTLAFVFFQLYPFQPFQCLSIKVLEGKIAQGGVMKYQIALSKTADVSGTRNRHLVSVDDNGPQRVYNLSSAWGSLPVGRKDLVQEVAIPDYIIPGKYKLFVVVNYDYPFWRQVKISYETEPFEVVKKTSCGEDKNK